MASSVIADDNAISVGNNEGIRGFLAAHPLMLLLPFCAAVVLFRFDPNMDYQWDDFNYVLLIHSFSHGLGKVLVNDPQMAQSQLLPVGLPLLLTPVALIWENAVAYKFVVFGFYLLGVALIYRFFSTNFGSTLALFVTASTALNIYVIEYAYQVYSETFYIVFSMLGCIALVRYRRARSVVGWELLLAAVVMNTVIYTRALGLALLLAGLLWLVWEGNWRKSVALLSSTLLISAPLQLGWVLGSATGWTGGYSSHFRLDELARLLQSNLVGYVFNVVRLIIELPYEALELSGLPATSPLFITMLMLLLVVTLGLIALGMLKERNAVGRLLMLYGLIYMAVLLAWPYAAHPRFAMPILPLLLYFMAQGWSIITRKLAPRNHRLALLGLMLVVVGCSIGQEIEVGIGAGRNLSRNTAEYGLPSHYAPEEASFIEAGEWLGQHSASSAVVVTSNPYDFYLWSGRRTVAYQFVPSIAEALQQGDYAAVSTNSDGTPSDVVSYANAHPQQLQLIYQTAGARPAYVYKIVK